jgi:hypothetical protein
VTGVRIPEAHADIAAELRGQGWTAEQAGSGHIRSISPDGAVVIASASPSDRRSKQALVMQLRQAGAVIGGRAGTRGSGQPDDGERLPRSAPAPAVSGPPAPAEPAGLRELVSEARLPLADLRAERREVERLLADLRAERREVERLLAEDAADLIVAEIVRQFAGFDVQAVVTNTMTRLHEANAAELAKFNKMMAKFDRAAAHRMDDADEAISALKAIRDRWEAAAFPGARTAVQVPPGYQRRR